MKNFKKIGFPLIAISLLGGLLVFGLYITKQQQEDLPKFQQSLMKENQSSEQAVSDVTKPSIITKSIKNRLTYEVGGMVIPDLSLNMSINEGMDENSITYGAGIDMPNSSIDTMGKGNFILASHDFPNTFGKLINATEGMLIYTTDLTYIYTFRVSDTFTADNDNVRDIKRVREQVAGVNKLTLYTCLGELGTPLRTVIMADLVTMGTIEDVLEQTKDLFS